MSDDRFTYEITVRKDAPIDYKPHWEVRKYDDKKQEIARFPIEFDRLDAAIDKEKGSGATITNSAREKLRIGIYNKDWTFSCFYWGNGQIHIFNLDFSGKKTNSHIKGGRERPAFDSLDLVIERDSVPIRLPIRFIRASAVAIDGISGRSDRSIPPHMVRATPDSIPGLSSDNGTVRGRLIHSVINHPYRSLLGLVLTAFFLALLLTPAMLPTFVAPIIVGMQKVFIPYLMAKGLSLGVIASVGSFLTFTAPKWVGNICQFVGARIFGGLFERILLAPFLLILLPVKKELVEKYGSDFMKGPQVLLLIPAGLSKLIGGLLNAVGNVIAGENEVMSNPLPESDLSSSFVIRKLITYTDSEVAEEYPSLKFAAADPAILFPEQRHQLSHKYAEALRFFDKNSPLPSIAQFTNVPEKSYGREP